MSLIAGIGAVAGGVIGGSIAEGAVRSGSAGITSAIDVASAQISGSIDELEKTVRRTGRDITAELEKLHVDFATAFHLSTERSRALEEEIEMIESVQEDIVLDDDCTRGAIAEDKRMIGYYEEKLEEGIGSGRWEITEEFARQQIEKYKRKITCWEKELEKNRTESELWDKKREYVEQELEKERKRLCDTRGELTTAEETRAELEEAFKRIEAKK